MRNSITFFAGISQIVLFCIFIPLSIVFYDGKDLLNPQYNILYNYLSDLGNYIYNPRGAIFFNIYIICSGIIFYIFFLGMGQLNYIKKVNMKYIRIIQILGVIAGTATIMVGIFTENAEIYHQFWTGVFFLTFFLILLYTYNAFRNSSKILQISYYIFTSIIIYLLLIVSLTPVLEWLAIFVIFGFMIVILYNTKPVRRTLTIRL